MQQAVKKSIIFQEDIEKPLPKSNKKNLIGLSKEELTKEIENLGEKKFRAQQIWHWMYNKGARSFDEMSNIGKTMREQLKEQFSLERPTITKDLLSEDTTRKWLIEFAPGQEAETVHIPESDRGALCISSQVGCNLTCTFCHTGTQNWVRNLTPYDIVSQLLIARDCQNEWPSTKEPRFISNIVFMGMGEPLLNYDNVIKATKILSDGDGIAISRRRITLSTSGIVPKIYDLGNDAGVNLAISLHAVTDELRDEIVPINRKYPIKELLDACRNYPALSNNQRITFEYVMLKGINDSEAEARELIRLIKGIPAKVNLIPFNPWPGSNYECTPWKQIEKFAKIVNNAGYPCPIRMPRGRDILAACGQLKSLSVRERKNNKPSCNNTSPSHPPSAT